MAHAFLFLVHPEDVDTKVSPRMLRIVGDEHHHLTRVLRARPGDAILATDGRGQVYDGEISEIGAEATSVRVGGIRMRPGEPALDLTVAHGLPQLPRYEWALEKCTELGVRSFQPMLCQRGSVRAGGDKTARWQRVIRSAMKQSGRCILPEVLPLNTFASVVAQGRDYAFRLIAHQAENPEEGPDPALPDCRGKTGQCLVLIGPESGFSPQELQLAADNDFTVFDLGARRLRSETAAVAAATLLLAGT